MKPLTLFLAVATAAFGQTRAAEIEAARDTRAAALTPAPPPSKAAAIGGKLLSGMSAPPGVQKTGFSIKFGGLATGSGLALGPKYTWTAGNVYEPKLVWESYLVGSYRGFYRAQTGLELPRLARHAFAGFTAFRFDYPQLSYYGEGPETRQTSRTNYRMQNNSIEVHAGGQLFQTRFRIGLLAAYQNIVIRRGTDSAYPDAQDVYPAVTASGSGKQANFLSGGFFVQYEGRDVPNDPHGGTYLLARFQNINGSTRAVGGFNQYDFEAQQYLHFFNKRRVIAARIKSTLTTPHAGSFVPFYLEPRLGTSSDLRGFDAYRFYDQNAVVATLEYRWAVFRPLDMAIFADAGKVYHDVDRFSLARIQTDVGFGFRTRAAGRVPLRVDIGVSREGARVWVSFYNVF